MSHRLWLMAGAIGLASILGALVCAWNYGFFYIIIPSLRYSHSYSSEEYLEQRKISFFVPSYENQSAMQTFCLSVPWVHVKPQKNAEQIIKKWLFLQQESEIISRKIFIESVIIDETGETVYISFSDKWFRKTWSMHFTMKLIKSLVKSLQVHCQQVQRIFFLIQHKPCDHPYLDLSIPLACNLFE